MVLCLPVARVSSPPEPMAQTEPCCLERCYYSAVVIRHVLRLLSGRAWDREAGRYYGCTEEELESVLFPYAGYDTDRLGGFGPGGGSRALPLLEGIRRAQLAGCRTPEQIASHLCPFNRMGQDDDLLEAA